MPLIFWLVPFSAVAALVVAFLFYRQMFRYDEGTDLMKEIAGHVREGASAYLRQQYKVVIIVFIVISLVLSLLAYGLGVQNQWVPFAFFTGGIFSAFAGFVGMRTATFASSRVANACRESLNGGLRLAFRSGAVMGLVVVGLVLLDISGWFIVLNTFLPETGDGFKLMSITAIMLTFALGASTQALFARVGGGIFTKAADVGADLVGKVESGIPEDDPRNPAAIADNVGDNVGDVAGMGADLFESFLVSILASALLGAAAFFDYGPHMQMNAVIAPMLIAATGTLLSIPGIFMVRAKEGASQKQLLGSLNLGVNFTAFFILIFSLIILYALGLPNYLGIWAAIVIGLLAGIGIGKSTEYFTSSSYRPTKNIAKSSASGYGPVIISGFGTGLFSAAVPMIIAVVVITFTYFCAAGFTFDIANLNYGLYGIALSAVGMLSTLGITLATDAYGPIADNAGGSVEMAGLGPNVRKRTDALDALGNTTAATGKGFAIGSAALTALALLASYFEEVKMFFIKVIEKPDILINGMPAIEAEFIDYVHHFELHIMNPRMIAGVMTGVMAVFLFAGLTMNAVGRAAQKMVEEVRRQFKANPGILEGTSKPDYARCVEISTKGAQKEMLAPALIALLIPVVVGFIFGVAGISGLLVGTIISGFAVAVFMANAGGAWDNAKKYIEEGHYGGTGSDSHKASIVGDTVGDPFKDTSGPSLNILIKLMAISSVITVGIAVSYNIF